jgi:hypothetical protein
MSSTCGHLLRELMFLSSLGNVRILLVHDHTTEKVYTSALTHPFFPDLIYSIAGCLAWFIALTTWYALFVNKRVAWGATADRITVVIPKGV